MTGKRLPKWIDRPTKEGPTFGGKNFFYPRKPNALEKSLDQLKDSLAQLKTKLQKPLDAKFIEKR